VSGGSPGSNRRRH